jgi:hypothetical protein
MSSPIKNGLPRRVVPLFCAAILLSAIGAATALAQHARSSQHKSVASGTRVSLTAQSDGRVTSVALQGNSVLVTGVAASRGAEVARTLWYESVEAAAFAEKTGANTLTRKVVDPAGNVLKMQTDPVHASIPTADAPLRVSPVDLSGSLVRARSVGATVVHTEYIPLFGGTGEVVVQSSAPDSFLKNVSRFSTALLGPVGDANSPYLLTVVDSTQTPLLVLGYTPGLGGGIGQGFAWQAPNVRSDATWAGQ